VVVVRWSRWAAGGNQRAATLQQGNARLEVEEEVTLSAVEGWALLLLLYQSTAAMQPQRLLARLLLLLLLQVLSQWMLRLRKAPHCLFGGKKKARGRGHRSKRRGSGCTTSRRTPHSTARSYLSELQTPPKTTRPPPRPQRTAATALLREVSRQNREEE